MIWQVSEDEGARILAAISVVCVGSRENKLEGKRPGVKDPAPGKGPAEEPRCARPRSISGDGGIRVEGRAGPRGRTYPSA